MPLGTKLLFGHKRRDLDDKIMWVKVSDNNDFVTIASCGTDSFDKREWNSPSRARRNQGNNYYPHSNIHQWLNARGGAQWQPMHEFDNTYSGTIQGFGDQFTDAEYAAIIEREIEVVTPPGSKKQFPPTSKMNVKVTLPAASEIWDGFECQEGSFLPTLWRVVGGCFQVMTRTGFKDPSHIVCFSNGERYYAPADEYSRIYPMIRLFPDTEIVKSDVSDSDSLVFEVLYPEIADCEEYIEALNNIVFMRSAV